MDSPGAQRATFRLYLITDRRRLKPGALAAACEEALASAAAIRPGSAALQLRDKDLGGRELYQLALKLREICTRYRAPFIVNDRVDVALACGADGVHLPADSFAPADARRLLGPSRLIGVSTHSTEEVARAGQAGADFVVYGPVFAPLSKAAGYAPLRGADGLAAACRSMPIPVYALGGITAERVHRLGGLGMAGVAAIGAVFGADSPAEATRALIEAVERLSPSQPETV